jgi:hypothetical protein
MTWAIGGAFLILLIAESLTSWLFIRGSRTKHPSLWQHAGCPTLLGNGDLMSAWPLIRYVRRRDYAALPDGAAVAFADRMRMPMIISYWAALASAVALVASLLGATG